MLVTCISSISPETLSSPSPTTSKRGSPIAASGATQTPAPVAIAAAADTPEELPEEAARALIPCPIPESSASALNDVLPACA